MDIVDKIIAYEVGELNADESIKLFQELIDTNKIKGLQGHYGRTASQLITAGLCTPRVINRKAQTQNV